MSAQRPIRRLRARLRPLADEAGFTLIEILVAAIVLAVGVVASASVLASSDSNTLDAELQQIASEQAEIAIEELRSLDWDQVGHATSPEEPLGEGRLSGDAYDVGTGSNEDLVIAANDEGGDSTGGILDAQAQPPPAIEQARPFTVDSDPDDPSSVKFTGKVYSFVTWRNEDCQVLDVVPFTDRLQDLIDDLQASSANLSGLRDSVLGIFGSLPGIPPSVRDIYATLIPNTVADLDAAAATLDALIDDVQAGSVDVCDIAAVTVAAMDGLVDPDGVGGLSASADILGVNADLNAAVSGVNVPLVGGLVCALLGSFCSDSQNLETEINTGGLGASLTGIDADAAAILGGFSTGTDHNTKRVTIAVTIDTTRDDITPRNVVYEASVLINPEDGLL